jgi:hypothetical protein
MSTLLVLCKTLYALPDCGAGGCLHILLDDNNYADSDLEWCKKYCEENAKGDEYDIAITILHMYSNMSIEERVFFDNLRCGYHIECHNPDLCKSCELIEIPWYIKEKQNERNL